MRLDATLQKLDTIIETRLSAAPKTRARLIRDRAIKTQNAVLQYRKTREKLPGCVGKRMV